MESESLMSLLLPEVDDFDDWLRFMPPPSASVSSTTSSSPHFPSSASCSDEDDSGYGCNPNATSPFCLSDPLLGYFPNFSSSPRADSFTSVLKLSDIASALHAFSKPSNASAFSVPSPLDHSTTRGLAMQEQGGLQVLMVKEEGAQEGNALPHVNRELVVAVDERETVRTQPLEAADVMAEKANARPAPAVQEQKMVVTMGEVKNICAPRKRSAVPAREPLLIPAKRRKVAPCVVAPCKKEALSTVDSEEEDEGTMQCSGDQSLSGKVGMSAREVHIQSERRRRRSMRESFSVLQSLLPKLKLKHTDRITVLTEVITYIQSLRGTLGELDKKRSDIMSLLGLPEDCYLGRSAANYDGGSSDEECHVSVRLAGADVFITFNNPKKKGVWSGALMLLQAYDIDIVNATLATSGDSSFHCIHGKASGPASFDSLDLQEKLEGVIVNELRRKPAADGSKAAAFVVKEQGP